MENNVFKRIEELENRQNPPKPAIVVFEGTFEHEEALKEQETNPDLQLVVITTKDCSKKTEEEMKQYLQKRLEKLETAKVIAVQSGVFVYDPFIKGDRERCRTEMQTAKATGLLVPRVKTIQEWEEMVRTHNYGDSGVMEEIKRDEQKKKEVTTQGSTGVEPKEATPEKRSSFLYLPNDGKK